MKYSWMILAVVLCGCDVEFQKEIDRQKDATTIRSTYYLKTVVHDEHLFILSTYGHFIHHPDCPCVKPTPAEKPTLSPIIIEGLPSVLLK